MVPVRIARFFPRLCIKNRQRFYQASPFLPSMTRRAKHHDDPIPIVRATESGWISFRVYPRNAAEVSARALPALSRFHGRPHPPLHAHGYKQSRQRSGLAGAAIATAASGDTINFANKLDGKTIVLTSGELAISTSLDIEGPGADELTISGGGSSRVFDVTTSGLNVTIAGLTITDGLAPQGGGVIDQGGASPWITTPSPATSRSRLTRATPRKVEAFLSLSTRLAIRERSPSRVLTFTPILSRAHPR